MDINNIWTIANVLASGGLVTLFTLRSARQKAAAEAKKVEAGVDADELDNVEKAIAIWRKMAEDLQVALNDQQKRYDAVVRQMTQVQSTLDKVHRSNTEILKKLAQITTENLNETIEDIKKELHNAHDTIINSGNTH